MTQPNAVMLAQIIGRPDGKVQADLMPGLEPDDAIAMCNQCIQALAARQLQLLHATRQAKPQIIVPKLGFRP